MLTGKKQLKKQINTLSIQLSRVAYSLYISSILRHIAVVNITKMLNNYKSCLFNTISFSKIWNLIMGRHDSSVGRAFFFQPKGEWFDSVLASYLLRFQDTKIP